MRKVTLITATFLFFLKSALFSKPTITYFQEDISEKARKIVLEFNDVISQALTEITGVDPDFSFEFYCTKLPYFGWSTHREFFNTCNCEDWWYEKRFHEEYSHEIAQIFFDYNLGGINDDIDGGKYKKYFSPHYVVREDEHISFALSTVFWNDFADKYGVRKEMGGFLPPLGYKISMDSEFFKVLKTLNAATVHHTEVDYHRFIDFSFYVGQMLYVKLYFYDPDFFIDFIPQNIPKGSYPEPFKSIKDYANHIINSFKKSGETKVDGMPVEEFVWEHPDFRRFTEDYTKRYYFDAVLVDYKKTTWTPYFFFNLTRINPSNFCFILTSFKNYKEGSGVFNQEPDHSVDNLKVSYRLTTEKGETVATGISRLLLNQTDYCLNDIPVDLPNGRYFLEAEVELENGSVLKDKVDFVIKKERNFYTDEIQGYNYIVMKNTKIGDSCYYIKLSLIDGFIKLDELNSVSCSPQSRSDITINPDGSITLKNIYYKGKFYNLTIKATEKRFFFKVKAIEEVF